MLNKLDRGPCQQDFVQILCKFRQRCTCGRLFSARLGKGKGEGYTAISASEGS